MSREDKKRIFVNRYFIFIFICSLFLTIGYAALSSSIYLEGKTSAVIRGAFYIDTAYVSDNNSATESTIVEFEDTNMYSSVTFGDLNTAFITYTVTIYNGTTTTKQFAGVNYNVSSSVSSKIEYELDDISIGDTVAPGSSKTFTITYKYKDGSNPGTYNLDVTFRFGDFYKVNYVNIVNEGYPTLVEANTDLVVKFKNFTNKTFVVNGASNFSYNQETSTLTVPNVSNDLTIIVSTIIDDNPVTEEDPDYSTIGGNGFYYDSETGTYYFRGNVDNYFSFAGSIWRIVSLDSNGNIKLIKETSIGNSIWYGNTNIGSLQNALTRSNYENSVAKTTLDTWYNNNIANNNNYSSKIVPTVFCIDQSYEQKQSSGTNKPVYYFGSYLRVGVDANNFNPSFACASEYQKTYNIGLLSADEASYAGGKFNTNNTNYYLYNGATTWLISPAYYDNDLKTIGIFNLTSAGNLNDWPGTTTINTSLGLRPVITINGQYPLIGSGTSQDPYKYAE